MAIASHKPSSTPNATPSVPRVEPQNYKSVIYSDDNIPLSSLIAYISGAPYTCDYYKQVVGEHNDLREIDPGQPNVYQQYELIHDLEIRVSNPLSSAYDGTTGITSVTGSGLVYPFMIPNIADYFVSDAGDNLKGLFRITSVERKNFSRDSAFYIEYEMVGYTDALQTLYSDLVSKVIREYHFSKERLIEGLQPILTTDSYQQTTNLKALYSEIVQYYFQTFYSSHYSTLVLPGQQYGIYDSFLVDYLFKIIDVFDAYEMRLIKQIAVDKDPFIAQPQFWQMLLNRDPQMLSYCNREMSLANKRVFNSNAFIHGIYFSNIDYIVYPTSPDLTTRIADHPEAKTISLEELQEVTNVHGTLADLINNQYVGPTATFPLIHLVTADTSYVLSNAFYDNTSGKSVLEILTKDYLNQQSIDLPMLTALAQAYRNLGRLEQFYYGPIIMTLIKEVNRSTYS